MNIVREYFPNGMPMLIQGVLTESNIVDTASVRVHPLIGTGKGFYLPCRYWRMTASPLPRRTG